MFGCFDVGLISNGSTDGNLTTDSPAEPLAVRIAVPIVFFAIFVVGLTGNGTLIYTVAKNASMRTKPNVLIVSLALGDFLLILVSVPFNSTIYTFDHWCYGQAVCKATEFMQTVSVGVSVFTLAALSADRFIAIVYPFTSYTAVTMTRILATAATVWAAAILLAIVDAVGADVRLCNTCTRNVTICNAYPDEWGKGYADFRLVFRAVVYFLLPVLVIGTLYSLIARTLLAAGGPRGSEFVLFPMGLAAAGASEATAAAAVSSSTPTTPNRRFESRKRVAKVVLSFVVIFVACWFPRNFYILWFNYGDFLYNEGWHAFKIVTFCLCFIYSTLNPFALYFLNDDFCQYFRYYLFRRCNDRWRRLPTGRLNSIQSATVRYSVVQHTQR